MFVFHPRPVIGCGYRHHLMGPRLQAGELQEELGLRNANATSASVSGFLSFMGFLFFGTLLSILSIVLIPWVIVYSIFISIQKNHGNRT
jgi:hypothetical protein